MKILSILLLFFIGVEITQAQTSHNPILEDPKVKYYDLEGRPVQPGFFKEVTMGFQKVFYHGKNRGRHSDKRKSLDRYHTKR